MEVKQYEKLLAMTLEKLEQAETTVLLQKYEINQLKKQIDNLMHKEDVKKVMTEIKDKL